ncbi:DNA topoisomerase IB [Novilysobacter erysipheiresistens]|uniref:DNA topoisomerase IB n=1 Tax=Novilysobacter erysipheiresistens TaxID=1749332 RepID=A0ABU7Z0S5_9GAMM
MDAIDASTRESEGQVVADQAGLRYVHDDEPGIRRRRAGRGFSYLDAEGGRVDSEATLQRIRELAVPPAWTDVWICRTRNGHLQATGRDARGRKQYRYHPEWAKVRGEGKFDRIVAFGTHLPRLRRRLRRDLALPGFPQQKVAAIVVALLADSLARVGNGSYARDNRSYGLTTLRNRHIAFLRGGRARISFRGKGGTAQEITVDDARLSRLVRRCQQLPGQRLFQYRDDEGAVRPVDSDQVNAYLHEVMGEAFTAKDFRTWGGTLAAFREFAAAGPPDDPDAASVPSRRNGVVKAVAATLCNTPAVCRKAYIDPVVFDGWLDGRIARASANARGARQWEKALLKFLKAAHRHDTAQRR